MWVSFRFFKKKSSKYILHIKTFTHVKCTAKIFVVTNTITVHIYRTFSSPQQGPWHPNLIAIPAQAIANQLSLSVSLPCLDMSCKCDCNMWSFVSNLFHLFQKNVFEVFRDVTCQLSIPFSFLSSIPLYGVPHFAYPFTT